jgi:hypothetical protein
MEESMEFYTRVMSDDVIQDSFSWDAAPDIAEQTVLLRYLLLKYVSGNEHTKAVVAHDVGRLFLDNAQTFIGDINV